MEISTAVTLALVLCIALWVPFFIANIGRGRARGHTCFTWWKPRGHSDIGPDAGGIDRLDRAQAMRGVFITNWAMRLNGDGSSARRHPEVTNSVTRAACQGYRRS
jgi:hypothetical protein